MKNINPKRILYKISGECLMGNSGFGHDFETIRLLCIDIKKALTTGVEICIVVGGGNIYRGSQAEIAGVERTTGDYMGMLATVMNAMALQNILEQIGVETRVMSAIEMSSVCEPYIRRKALRHLQKGRVIIFAAGIGNPFFTTDTTATLRALEMNCDILVKGTSVDGIYSADPKKNTDAKRYEQISHKEVIEKNLRIMDISAISLAMDRNLKIAVFCIKQDMPLSKLLSGDSTFTIVG